MRSQSLIPTQHNASSFRWHTREFPALLAMFGFRDPKTVQVMTDGALRDTTIYEPHDMRPTQEERGIDPGGDCDCEFEPFDDGGKEESYHYKRSCRSCGKSFWSTHCIHEGVRVCGGGVLGEEGPCSALVERYMGYVRRRSEMPAKFMGWSGR